MFLLGRTTFRTISPVPMSPADRRLTRFVVLSTIGGIALVGLGAWIFLHPLPPQDDPLAHSGVWFGVVIVGVLALVLPWVEVRRRARRGPGEAGRHTRS
jgi:hypothetical protein